MRNLVSLFFYSLAEKFFLSNQITPHGIEQSPFLTFSIDSYIIFQAFSFKINKKKLFVYQFLTVQCHLSHLRTIFVIAFTCKFIDKKASLKTASEEMTNRWRVFTHICVYAEICFGVCVECSRQFRKNLKQRY